MKPQHAKHKAHQQFQWHYTGGHSMHSTSSQHAQHKAHKRILQNIRYYFPVVHTARAMAKESMSCPNALSNSPSGLTR